MQLIAINVAAVLSFSLVLLAPGTSAADRLVNSGEILLLSDEILGNSVEIERAGGGAPPGNHSGLGDGSNPGQGSGISNSPNEGTDNPSQYNGDDGEDSGSDSASDSGDSDSDSGDSDSDSD